MSKGHPSTFTFDRKSPLIKNIYEPFIITSIITSRNLVHIYGKIIEIHI